MDLVKFIEILIIWILAREIIFGLFLLIVAIIVALIIGAMALYNHFF